MAAAIPLAIAAISAGIVSVGTAIGAAIAWETRARVEHGEMDLKGLITLSQPKPVDLRRYCGTWFEQRRIDSWFENNVQQVTARYSLRDDGLVAVVNSSVRNDGTVDVAHGIARQTHRNGVLLVSFVPLIESPYVILFLDESYTMSVVGSPDRKVLWLLTRDRNVTPAQLAQFATTALQNGYTQDQLDAIVVVKQ